MLADNEVLLLLGGNIGDPLDFFSAAEVELSTDVGHIVSRSRDHWTEPVGFVDSRLFLNRALIIRTEMEPNELLENCLRIESNAGRKRSGALAYEARTLDVDILLFGDRTIDLPELRIPHPRIQERWFALAPAADVCPEAIHPELQLSVLQLLGRIGHM